MLKKLSYGPYIVTEEDQTVFEEMLETEGIYFEKGEVILDADANAWSMIHALIRLFNMMGYDKKITLEAVIKEGTDAAGELKRLNEKDEKDKK